MPADGDGPRVDLDAAELPAERRDDRADLDTKIMRSSAWAVVGFGGTNFLSLVTTLVLARLLTPADFGVVALTLTVLAVAHLAQDSGLGAALIVHRGPLRPAAASALVFSPVVATGLYVAAFVLAPVFADVFDSTALTNVLRVTAITLLLRGLAIMPLALLQREMRFGAVTTIELGGGVAQAGTAITLAAAGAGVWSLVAGHLALATAQLVLSWTFAPIRPSPTEARRETLRELMRFGRHVGVANVVNYGNSSAEGLVVGRILGTTVLGYYTLASRLASMPVGVIGNVLGRGVYAALARLQDDMPGFRRVWLENVQRVALFAVPATIGTIAVAEPLVVALLGERWRPAIVPLQILALYGLVKAFAATSGEVFQALRRPHLRVYVEVAHLVLLVPALIVGSRWHGIDGAAAAVFAVNCATGIPVVIVLMRLLAVPAAELAAMLSRPALGWLALALVLLALRPFVDDVSAGMELAVLAVAGALVYAAAVALFARGIVVTMWLSLRGARPEA